MNYLDNSVRFPPAPHVLMLISLLSGPSTCHTVNKEKPLINYQCPTHGCPAQPRSTDPASQLLV